MKQAKITQPNLSVTSGGTAWLTNSPTVKKLRNEPRVLTSLSSQLTTRKGISSQQNLPISIKQAFPCFSKCWHLHWKHTGKLTYTSSLLEYPAPPQTCTELWPLQFPSLNLVLPVYLCISRNEVWIHTATWVPHQPGLQPRCDSKHSFKHRRAGITETQKQIMAWSWKEKIDLKSFTNPEAFSKTKTWPLRLIWRDKQLLSSP